MSYQVVVSFRADPDPAWSWGPEEIETALRRRLALWPSPHNPAEDLTVHVREIGAGGESSEMEGEWPPDGTSEQATAATRTAPGPPQGGC
jgi:hypothetical protein